jgi:hypothetical protein
MQRSRFKIKRLPGCYSICYRIPRRTDPMRRMPKITYGRRTRSHCAHMESIRFEKYIRHYDRYYRTRRKHELEFFAGQPTVRLAISSAALARGPGGKKLKHQHRLPDSDLRKAKQALLAAERQITRCTTFDELHQVVATAVRDIWKNPELYAYDAALHIGAKLSLKPEKVYLHRGTRVGAQKLGLETKAATLDVSALPEKFRELEPEDIEDILCIYKDKF